MITVVIPTHNRPEDLQGAVRSVFEQAVLPGELIVVDDGSDPAVSEDLFREAPVGMQTRLIRNDVAAGANNARNRGIHEASGEWIAFLDDDDRFLPEKVQVLREAIESGEPSDLIYHPALIDLVQEGVQYVSSPLSVSDPEEAFGNLLYRNIIGGTPMVTVRRDKLLEVGLFDEEMPALQDRELWMRLAEHGARFRYVDRPLTRYRLSTRKGSVSKDFEANDAALHQLFDKYRSRYDQMDQQELDRCDEFILKDRIRRSILNREVRESARYCFKAFVRHKKLKYIGAFFSAIMGPKITYSLRKLFSSRFE